MKTGVFYGSTSGKTRETAFRIADILGLRHAVFDIAETKAEEFFSFDFIIAGTSTWDIGKIQESWDHFSGFLIPGSMVQKRCVLFGLGDQGSYPDTFADGLGILKDLFRKAGAQILLPWPSEGYSFESSLAIQGGSFAGLVLDEDSEPEKTVERLESWICLLKEEIKRSECAFA